MGFSATTSGFLDAWEMAAAVKEARPGVVTVFGGVHVSALGKDAAGAVCPYRLSLSGGRGGDPDRACGGGRPGPDRRPDLEGRGRGGRQRPAGAASGPRRPAVSRLRKTGRVSPGVQSAAVQLHPVSRRHDDHQPGLHLPVFLLRPLRVQAGVPLELPGLHLRPHATPPDPLRGPPPQHLRRSLYRQPAADRRTLRHADPESAGDAVQLRRPGRPDGPGTPRDAQGGGMSDGLARHRVGRPGDAPAAQGRRDAGGGPRRRWR